MLLEIEMHCISIDHMLYGNIVLEKIVKATFNPFKSIFDSYRNQSINWQIDKI